MKVYVKDPDKFLGVIFITMLVVLVYSAFKFWVFGTFEKFLIWFGILIVSGAIFTYLALNTEEE